MPHDRYGAYSLAGMSKNPAAATTARAPSSNPPMIRKYMKVLSISGLSGHNNRPRTATSALSRHGDVALPSRGKSTIRFLRDPVHLRLLPALHYVVKARLAVDVGSPCKVVLHSR